MSQVTKRISVLFFAGALAALILLSASLSNLQLQAGTPFPGSQNSEERISSSVEHTPLNAFSVPIIKGLLALIFLIVIIYLSSRLLKLVNMRKTLQLMLGVTLLFIVVSLLFHATPGEPSHLPTGSSEIATPPSFDYPVAPLGRPPESLIQFVLAAFVVGSAFFAVRILKLWLNKPKIKTQLSREAELAVEAILAGGDLRDVIIRCYVQMTRILQEERGIKRNSSMTVREFEVWLERKGFPIIPVHRLSTLFEKVRYSTQPMLEDDERIALASLNELIRYCESKAG